MGSRAVFLHTGWRSGGTWLWSQCRKQSRVRALYEPLHEAIADLRQSDIAKLRPGSWHSNHGNTAPYFEEYRGLIQQNRRGIALYQPRFAFDSFFLDPDEEDPELEAYLHAVLAISMTTGQTAVLKFCRSLGRVGWAERRFSKALHIVVLRRPLTQWRSCQRLMIHERNRYFTIAPVLVLARNAHYPRVRQACEALGVRLPRLDSTDMAYGMETVGRHLRQQDTAARYRAFLAYWTATALSALHSTAMVIDTAQLAAEPGPRGALEAALEARTGARIDLAARAAPPPAVDGPSPRQLAMAHQDASAFVEAHRDALSPQNLALLLHRLAEPGMSEAAGRECSARLAHLTASRAAENRMPPASAPATAWRRVRTAAEIVFARALQPLRRLHGRLARRMHDRRRQIT